MTNLLRRNFIIRSLGVSLASLVGLRIKATDIKLENKQDIPAPDAWPSCLVHDLLPHEAFWAGDDYRSYLPRFAQLKKKEWYWFEGGCFKASRRAMEHLAQSYGVKLRLTDLHPDHPEYVHLRVELLGPADPRFERAAFDEPQTSRFLQS